MLVCSTAVAVDVVSLTDGTMATPVGKGFEFPPPVMPVALLALASTGGFVGLVRMLDGERFVAVGAPPVHVTGTCSPLIKHVVNCDLVAAGTHGDADDATPSAVLSVGGGGLSQCVHPCQPFCL